MNKKGRKRFKAGGALKPVDPKTQKRFNLCGYRQ